MLGGDIGWNVHELREPYPDEVGNELEPEVGLPDELLFTACRRVPRLSDCAVPSRAGIVRRLRIGALE